jgi:hypothetical protein
MKFLPTHGIDISAMTEEERLEIFNDVFPVGLLKQFRQSSRFTGT